MSDGVKKKVRWKVCSQNQRMKLLGGVRDAVELRLRSGPVGAT
jgi:hypothetical protein